MEKMPYQEYADVDAVMSTVPLADLGARTDNWRAGLPELTGSLVTLRDLRTSDAASLFTAMATAEVTRFISPPPTTLEGFERFIAWTHRQRTAGQYVCFAVVPRGSDIAVGLFQVRSLEPDFGTAEWGFALASEFWGTGMFVDGARLVIEFTFDVIGSHRLEARAAIKNGRGGGALQKLGAVREGVLRKSLLRNGEYLDQCVWTILAEEWRDSGAAWGAQIIH
jgi:ribosomal-protein-alanine N-acetyltransferase